MRFMLILTVFIGVIALAQPALAQSAGHMRTVEQLEKINSYRPEQSGKHTRSRDVFSKRLLDDTNRVVGEVDDVILHRSGAINMLDIDFNRLRLDTGNLFIDYDDLGIRPVSNGYKMTRTDDQIKEMVPSLLAGMSSASGPKSGNYSAKKLIGRKVYAADGRPLATIKDVLFDSKGTHADMLFVTMNQRPVKGEKFAIPFSKASFRGKKITVKNNFAEAMIDYAKEN